MTLNRQDEDALIDEISLPRSVSPHPKALLNFSIARFFERLAFFAMCQWLILFLIAKASGPEDTDAYYNAYQWVILAVVVAQIPGGLFIDLYYNRRKAVVWGGAMLALGYFLLALNHDVVTVMALVLSFVGMGLYGVGSTGALASYYRGRGQYLGAGLYFYTAAINAAAFVGSIALGHAAANLSWQQGSMLAAIMMMVGHVYLLAVAKTFQEPKLPRGASPDSEEKTKPKLAKGGQSRVVLAITMVSFLLAAFAFNAGHKSMHNVEAWGAWSDHTRTVAYLLSAGLALIGSYLFTRQAVSSSKLLGYGLLLTVVSGILLPPLLTGTVGLGSGTALVAGASLLLVLLVTAEALVTAPAYALILRRGGRLTHTFLGLLSVAVYLPFLGFILPELFNIRALSATLIMLGSIVFLVLAAWWLIRESKENAQ